MKTVTATRASRGFSEMLDQVESGEIIQITRDGRPVAELRPAAAATGNMLRRALAELPPLDEGIEDDIASALSMTTDERSAGQPDSGTAGGSWLAG